MNINLRNTDKMSELPSVIETLNTAEQDKFLVFESRVFMFPFIHIELQA